MRFAAEAPEHAAAEGDDVVGVDTVEPGGGRRSRPSPSARTASSRRREALRAMPPSRRPAGRRRDTRRTSGCRRAADTRRRTTVLATVRPVVRLEMRRDGDSSCAGGAGDECEPRVLGRPSPPPRDDDLVDAGASDLVHLGCRRPGGRTTSRSLAPGSTPRRCRRAGCGPSATNAGTRRRARWCRTRGSRTPRRAHLRGRSRARQTLGGAGRVGAGASRGSTDLPLAARSAAMGRAT